MGPHPKPQATKGEEESVLPRDEPASWLSITRGQLWKHIHTSNARQTAWVMFICFVYTQKNPIFF